MRISGLFRSSSVNESSEISALVEESIRTIVLEEMPSMSNQTNTSSQVISLPKGGGALSGIGEKFSPDLHTGTGNFTVPIALPPGRNGFQPELNLVYSTGNSNGPFGLGWSLSIPGVSRKTSAGVPLYNDNASRLEPGEWRDVFILSGAEDLVPVALWEPDPDRSGKTRMIENPAQYSKQTKLIEVHKNVRMDTTMERE